MRKLFLSVLIVSLAFISGCDVPSSSARARVPRQADIDQSTTNEPPEQVDGGAAGDNAASARAVIQRAVEAHGGIERLGKLKFQVCTMKGEITKFGGSVPATCEVSTDLPGKFRWVLEVDKGDQKVPLVLVLNGDKGWQVNFGAAKEMGKQQLEEVGNGLYVLWVTSLVALRDPGFELSPLPEIKVGDQPAAGVKVARKGKQDVKLYFDKKTGLLVKAEHKTTDGGLEVTRQFIFAEPKEFEGLKLPTKQVVIDNDKKAAEWTISGYKFPGKPDDSSFNKP